MKHSYRSLLLLGIGITLLTACSTVSRNALESRSVRKLDFSEAPQAKVLEAELRRAGDQWYPQICALLDDGQARFPRQFDICFKRRLQGGHLGETRLGQICLNASYLNQFRDEPSMLEQVLIHEATHVAEHYYRPIIGHWLVFTSRPPGCWEEGIADYACFKLGLTNALRCAQCGSVYPHYRHGYSCAAAFLLYVEQFNSSIVRQLNTALREGHYSDAFFLKATGKDLAALWSKFQQTPAFTPSASQMLGLQRQLGIIDGKPPADIEQRLEHLLDQQADAETLKLIREAHIPGMNTGDVQGRLALIAYFTQPGGTAEAYLVRLQKDDRLPGLAKGERGSLKGFLTTADLNLIFPVVRSFTAEKAGDASTYHYSVARLSREVDWRLQRAWRTDIHGRLMNEYPLE